ncbi:MAG: 30S ribosomal protein S9 [Candidatus Levybacteria bacterium]|nr:30S ribosomal protein S9 [Candidatus Levybacteria bacterium]
MPRKKQSENEIKEKKEVKPDYIHAVGRRKEAIARVRLYPSVKASLSWGDLSVKKGDLVVNGMPVENYFSGEVSKTQYEEPFRATDTLDKFAVTVRLEGGGLRGQLDALILGVSRALSRLDKDKFRPILKKKGFLKSDARVRERRKIGTGGKARRKKQSPKR